MTPWADDMTLQEIETRVYREAIADMRRVLMRKHLTLSMTLKDRDVVECFLVDYESERGLR